MDLAKAMFISESDDFRITPAEEAQAIRTLFNGRSHAIKAHDKIEGYTDWQLHYAAKNIIERQDHSFVMEGLALAVDDAISGTGQTDVAESPFLRGLANWDRLDNQTRVKFCTYVTEYIVDVMNAHLPLARPMHIEVSKHSHPLSHLYNYRTQEYQPYLSSVSSMRRDDHDCILYLNIHPDSAFKNPIQTVTGIYAEALKLWQSQMGRDVARAQPDVPPPLERIKNDAQRLFSLRSLEDKLAMEEVYGEGIFVQDRFAKKHAANLAASLGILLDMHKASIEPIQPKCGIAHILGL